MPNVSNATLVTTSSQISAGVVDTTAIKDGTIENIDVAAGAAIAKSKLAGVAGSGVNADITALTGLTTALTVPEGGTGKATIGAHKVLVGNDAGVITEITPDTAGKVLVSNGIATDPSFQDLNGVIHYAEDTGAANAVAVAPSPSVGSLAKGDVFLTKIKAANTGATTLNVNSLGALSIYKKFSTALAANDLLAGMMALFAYDENATTLATNVAASWTHTALNNTNWGLGYAMLPSKGKLTQITWQISNQNAPTGNAYAKIYAITGTYGTNALPTGAALAISDPIDVSTLTATLTDTIFTFSGANQILLDGSTHYFISIEYTGGNSSSLVSVSQIQGNSYGGNNGVQNTSGVWAASVNNDFDWLVTGTTGKFQMISLLGN